MSGRLNTDILAEYCASFKYDMIPADVLEKTKQVFMDTVGLMLGGGGLEKGEYAIKLAQSWGNSNECTIVGTNLKSSAFGAAYANGEIAHCLDADVLMAPAHVAPYIIPAVLAEAERNHISGKDFVTALVLAIDVASRVGLSQGPFRNDCDDKSLSRAQQMATVKSYGLGCDCFGGVAGIGNMLGFTEDQMKDAFGHCGFMLPQPSHHRFVFGPRAGMLKYSPTGWECAVAVASAAMAAMGEYADREIFDGEHGYWAMQGTPKRLEEWLTKDLGKFFAIRDVRYKYYPVDGTFQAPVNLTFEMVEENHIKVEDIEHIQVHIEYMVECFENKVIEYHTDSCNSMYWCVAAAAYAAANGIEPGPRWHKEMLKNPEVLALMDRIDYEEDPASEIAREKDNAEGHTYINRRPSTIDITLKDGRVITKSQEWMKFMSCGHPDYAMTFDKLEVKFRRNSKYVLSDEEMDQVVATIKELENVADMADFVKMLSK